MSVTQGTWGKFWKELKYFSNKIKQRRTHGTEIKNTRFLKVFMIMLLSVQDFKSLRSVVKPPWILRLINLCVKMTAFWDTAL
jgi:hypothetical protein